VISSEQVGSVRYSILADPTPTRRLNVESHLDDDEFFVRGDNRDRAFDSVATGPIKGDQIVGRVVSIWWSKDAPFARVRTFER
jgi:type IV secretory pathway protease TraF